MATIPDIRFKPSPKLYGYLRLLARDTMLGDNHNKVAEYLLTVETERRLLEGYHSKTVPTADAGSDDGEGD